MTDYNACLNEMFLQNNKLQTNNNSNDGSGDVTEDGSSNRLGAGVVAEVETEVNNGGNDSLNSVKDQKPNIREIGDTPKPLARLSKK